MFSGCIINNQLVSLPVAPLPQGQGDFVESKSSTRHQPRELWPRPDSIPLGPGSLGKAQTKCTRAIERPLCDFNLAPRFDLLIPSSSLMCVTPVQSSRVVRLLNLPVCSRFPLLSSHFLSLRYPFSVAALLPLYPLCFSCESLSELTTFLNSRLPCLRAVSCPRAPPLLSEMFSVLELRWLCGGFVKGRAAGC